MKHKKVFIFLMLIVLIIFSVDFNYVVNAATKIIGLKEYQIQFDIKPTDTEGCGIFDDNYWAMDGYSFLPTVSIKNPSSLATTFKVTYSIIDSNSTLGLVNTLEKNIPPGKNYTFKLKEVNASNICDYYNINITLSKKVSIGNYIQITNFTRKVYVADPVKLDVDYQYPLMIVYPDFETNFKGSIKNNGDISIDKVRVYENTLGTLGSTNTISPGDIMAFEKEFYLENSFTSVLKVDYTHPLLDGIKTYTYPEQPDINVQNIETNDRFVMDIVPEIEYLFNKKKIKIDFIFDNKADFNLANISCYNGEGEKIFFIEEDIPAGGNISHTYEFECEPDKAYEFKAYINIPSSSGCLKATNTLKVKRAVGDVIVSRSIKGEFLPYNEEVEIKYLIKNNGNSDLVNLQLKEKELGVIGTCELIPEGGQVEFSYSGKFIEDFISKPVLNATMSIEGSEEALNIEFEEKEFKINRLSLPNIIIDVIEKDVSNKESIYIKTNLFNNGNCDFEKISIEILGTSKDLEVLGSLNQGKLLEWNCNNIVSLKDYKTLTLKVIAEDVSGNKYEFFGEEISLKQTQNILDSKLFTWILAIVGVICILFVGIFIGRKRKSILEVEENTSDLKEQKEIEKHLEEEPVNQKESEMNCNQEEKE